MKKQLTGASVEFGQGENLCQCSLLYGPFSIQMQWLDGLSLFHKERGKVMCIGACGIVEQCEYVEWGRKLELEPEEVC